MVQLDFYDYFGKEKDPLYMLLKTLNENSTITINEFEVTLNQYGIYEICNESIHESKSTLDDCYTFIRNIMGDETLF